jgi:hypothetical protein
MKRWKIKLLALCVISFGSTAFAAKDMGLELGIRQQGGEALGANTSANAVLGFQGGFYAHIPMEQSPSVHFRTGVMYTQRPLQSENDVTGEKIDFRLDYLDIPIEILFKSSESFGFYMGLLVSINVAKSCSGNPNCEVKDIDTPYFPIIFGGVVKFSPKVGLNFYADGASAYVAKGLYDYKAVGINLTYSLD